MKNKIDYKNIFYLKNKNAVIVGGAGLIGREISLAYASFGSNVLILDKDKKNGQKIWSHNLWDEYNAKPGDRGYASSPMAYKDLLIVLAGGKGHGAMAFNLEDGQLIWKGQDFINSYSSPIIINVDGQDQLIVFVEKKVAALDPNTGDLLWQHTHNTQHQIHASTPIWGKDNIQKNPGLCSDYQNIYDDLNVPFYNQK